LPDTSQQRFFSIGVGGNAGTLNSAVNAIDRAEALKDYSVIVTDTGHIGSGTDSNWVVVADGKRDIAKITYFLYHSEYDVTVAGKQFGQSFYAAPVLRAYFDGCSNGGRMALMEADRYPSDHDGIVAGDPGMDYNSAMPRFVVQKGALASPGAYITQSLLAAIDKRSTARRDAIEGATDRLVHNPVRCPIQATA
jgi:feruloyl esterase